MTAAEAVKQIDKADAMNADLIEVRLDCFKDQNQLAEVATHGKTSKIATCKLRSNHGQFSGTEAEQLQMLFNSARNGFKYVDIELNHPKLKETIGELRQLSSIPIISFHDFSKTPRNSELRIVLNKEIASGAEVCKIVTTAKNIEDNLEVLNFTSTACKRAKIVCFAMGEKGKTSRLLSPLFGSYFTFASLERGNETATGQLTIQEMKTAYQILGH